MCPKKYNSNVSTAHLVEETDVKVEICECAEENVLVSLGEMVLMQTSKAEIQGHNNSEREHVRILLASGSQRTYVTEHLAEKLKLKIESAEEIK